MSFSLSPQAQLPEQMLEPTPRFGPAAKAARAKEREEEAARLAKEKKAAAAAKPAAKPQCAPGCFQTCTSHTAVMMPTATAHYCQAA